jgi:hypothetical protein
MKDQLEAYRLSSNDDFDSFRNNTLVMLVDAIIEAAKSKAFCTIEVRRHCDQISGACGEAAQCVDEGLASITFSFGKGVLLRSK